MQRNSFVFFQPDYAPNGKVQVSSLHLPDSLLTARMEAKPTADDKLKKVLYSISPALKPELVGDRCIKVESTEVNGLVQFALLHKLGLAHLEGQRILMFGNESPNFSSETGAWFLPACPTTSLYETLVYVETHLRTSNNDFLIVKNQKNETQFVQARPNAKGTWLVEYRDGHRDNHYQLIAPNVEWTAKLMLQWLKRDKRFIHHPWSKVGYDFVLFAPDPQTTWTSIKFLDTELPRRFYAKTSPNPTLAGLSRNLAQLLHKVPGIQLLQEPQLHGDRCIHLSVAQSSATEALSFLVNFAVKHQLGVLDLFRHLVVAYGNEDTRFELQTTQWSSPGVSFQALSAMLHAAQLGALECEPEFRFWVKTGKKQVTARYQGSFWVLTAGTSLERASGPVAAAKIIRRWLLQLEAVHNRSASSSKPITTPHTARRNLPDSAGVTPTSLSPATPHYSKQQPAQRQRHGLLFGQELFH